MEHWIDEIGPHLAAALSVLAALLATGHAVLHKRDVRAAVAWVGLIWLSPLIGVVLYMLLGINRIRRRAVSLQREAPTRVETGRLEMPAEAVARAGEQLVALARLMSQVVRRRLVEGNAIRPLPDGDTAYPAMIAAIDGAERSVTLATYIFDNDPAGHRFARALARARERGVEVRVLIDAVGLRYTWPRMDRVLRRMGVPVARFLPARVPWRMPYMNLRLHRKILVVDGRIGFTGGMNIRHGCELAARPQHPTRDLHFRVEGPIVRHLQEAFCEDWHFTTGERLEGEVYFPALAPAGPVVARGVIDGPDEDFEKLRWAFLGALACARSTVRIVTPYFLPDNALMWSLNVAARRGVVVDIVLPERNNLALVQWASTGFLPLMLEHGCRFWLTPPPFDHSKLMVVDAGWVCLGSGNWDPRSLRLNFEFNLECYDPDLGARMDAFAAERIARARPLTLEELAARPFPIRLRDAVARLLAPYL